MSRHNRMNRREFIELAGGASMVHFAGFSSFAADHEIVSRPLIPDLWGFGQLLAFSGLDGPTDYNFGLVARTLDDPPGIEILLPSGLIVPFGKPTGGPVEVTCDSFRLMTGNGAVRGAFVDAHHILIEGASAIDHLPEGLELATKNSTMLIGSKPHFQSKLLDLDIEEVITSRLSWYKRQIVPGRLGKPRTRTLAKAISVMKGQVNTPQGRLAHRWTTPDRWPHRDLWLWDSVFHAIGWRHLDRELAREMIEAVFDGQHPDGFVPHQANPQQTSSITQPPVLALGVQMVADPVSDRAWIEKLYPMLTRYLEWDLKHRIREGAGLASWLTDADSKSRCPESGMDNSPRFDHGSDLYAVDLNAFLSQECSIMAAFAQSLSLPRDAAEWTRRQTQLNQLINEQLWNDKDGFYFDFDPAKQSQTGVWAVTGFLPLLCGAAGPRQVRRLAAHLHNPGTFKTLAPIRSAIMPSGALDPHDMWRGPTWINTNWLVALGFEHSGRPDVAADLRQRTMREIERWYLPLGSLFEFYDEAGLIAPDRLPRKGYLEKGSSYHQAVHDYGWTSTLYADLVFTTSA